MHGFIKARLDAPEPITLAELCNALHDEVSAKPAREFEVLLAFTTVPGMPNGVPASWLKGPAVIAWLKESGFDTSGVRCPVAMVVSVRARDEHGAAQLARSESDRYAARALIATGRPLSRFPLLWVKGAREPATLKEDSRGVGVTELFREDRVFSTDVSQSVDAALELLAHLEESSPPAAVAGGGVQLKASSLIPAIGPVQRTTLPHWWLARFLAPNSLHCRTGRSKRILATALN
ncbi:hypothetical protein ACFSUI_00335 [Ralstonia solanacearum]